MKKSCFVFFAIFCGVLGKDCRKVDQCSCQFDDGTVVDITSLGNQDNSPRYVGILVRKLEFGKPTRLDIHQLVEQKTIRAAS